MKKSSISYYFLFKNNPTGKETHRRKYVAQENTTAAQPMSVQGDLERTNHRK